MALLPLVIAAATYVNPIINADYSDPDVVAAPDDHGYYMTASSFCNVPGLPILFSDDLVNWEIVNYALDRLVPEEFYSTPRHGKGVWAPSIRFHEGMYYIYWGDPDFGIYMVSATNPLGEWSAPVLVKEGRGLIDPCPLWDDDGRAYLVNGWAGSRAGFNSVLTVTELTPDGKSLKGNPIMVYDGNPDGNHTVEGPKFYKRDGYYYILAPAGGVEQGWQIALRSRSPFGPYEARKVMAQGNTGINGPHQGALVETPQGEPWFINFRDLGYMGRVLYLNPAQWTDDGWIVIGDDTDGDGCGEPVASYRMPVAGKRQGTGPRDSDDFGSTQLGRQWQWHANYAPEFGFTTPYGYMRVYGHKLSPGFVNFWEVPNLLTQKFPTDRFSATAELRVSAKSDGNQSGMIVMGHDYSRLTVEKDGDGFVLRQIDCTDAEQGGAERVTDIVRIPAGRHYEAGATPCDELNVWLRLDAGAGGKCRWSYSLDGKKFHKAGSPFTARQGKWIGARVGLFSVSPADVRERGWLDIYDFSIEK